LAGLLEAGRCGRGLLTPSVLVALTCIARELGLASFRARSAEELVAIERALPGAKAEALEVLLKDGGR